MLPSMLWSNLTTNNQHKAARMLHETSMKERERGRIKHDGVFKTAAVWCFLHNLIPKKTDSKGMYGITNFSDGVSWNLLALYTSIIRCYLLRKSHHNRNIRERSLIECIHRRLDWLCETDDNICCEYKIRWKRWRSVRDRAKKFNVSLARRLCVESYHDACIYSPLSCRSLKLFSHYI